MSILQITWLLVVGISLGVLLTSILVGPSCEKNSPPGEELKLAFAAALLVLLFSAAFALGSLCKLFGN